MKSMRLFLSLACGLATTAGTLAQPAIQPGRWEVQHTMKSDTGEIEKAVAQAKRELAAMPPEQRKMMEAMLAQQGVAMGSGGPPHVFTCISPEMAASRVLPVQQEGDCTTRLTRESGNTVDMDFVCTNPPSTGKGSFTVHDPRRYSGRWTIRTAAQKGQAAEVIDMEIRARWVSAACGGARPAPGKPSSRE